MDRLATGPLDLHIHNARPDLQAGHRDIQVLGLLPPVQNMQGFLGKGCVGAAGVDHVVDLPELANGAQTGGDGEEESQVRPVDHTLVFVVFFTPVAAGCRQVLPAQHFGDDTLETGAVDIGALDAEPRLTCSDFFGLLCRTIFRLGFAELV